MKTKYPPHQAYRILICVLAALTLAAFNPAARASTTNWITGSGDWFNAANWDNSVPTTSTDAFIDNAGTSQINGFQATARALSLGTGEFQSGTVTVDGTSGGFLSVGPCFNCDAAAVEGSVYVGRAGRGTLNITNGGKVISAGYAYVALLSNPSARRSSAVTVDGANSNWTVNNGRLYVGGDNATLAGGTALLSVTNGGTVTVNNPINAGAGLPVGPSGTLTGNGTVTLNATDSNGGFVARLAVINGTLAPTGTLSVNGNLALSSGATTLANVTPQAADRVDVLGTGTAGATLLGGRLIVVLSGGFTPDPSCVTRFTLLHADSGRLSNSEFSSVSIQGPPALYTAQITYDNNNVYLDLVFDNCTPPN